MGADAPILPIRIAPPPPTGRPRGGFNDKKPPCPAVPRRGPEAGNPPWEITRSNNLMIRS